jgi:hypothetical protein
MPSSSNGLSLRVVFPSRRYVSELETAFTEQDESNHKFSNTLRTEGRGIPPRNSEMQLLDPSMYEYETDLIQKRRMSIRKAVNYSVNEYEYPHTKTGPLNDNDDVKKLVTAMQVFQRRLDTAEDKFDVHKISTAVYVLSSTLMLLIGAMHGFSTVPRFLDIPTWLFFGSSLVQAITSIDMSLKYRANDPVVQKGFIGMASNIISLAWANLFVSPFAPDAFNNFYVGTGILAVTLVPIMCISVHQMMSLRECIDHRQIRNKEKGGDLGAAGDILSYGLGTTGGFVAGLVSLPVLLDPSHDRSWLLEVNAKGLLPSGDLFVPYSYYSTVMTSAAVAYGALAVTLRDKKLISKQMEQTIIGVPTVLFVISLLGVYGII